MMRSDALFSLIGRLRPVGLLAAVALLLSAVAACTDPTEAGVGGEGTGGLGSAIGRVDGFGSLNVAGADYDDRDARVTLEIDPRLRQALPLTEVKLGMRAALSVDGGTVRSIALLPELVAPVQAVEAANRRFYAAGQEVIIDAVPADPTRFDGFSRLADLEMNDVVEVYGERNAAGVLRASFIGRRAAGGGIRIMGTVQGWNPAAAEFTLHGLPIRVNGATLLPAGAAIANGQRVAVFGAALINEDWLPAQVVSVQPAALSQVAEARVGGLVAAFVSAADFKVGDVPVDASAATLAGAPLALTAGRLVQAEGPVIDGRLKARVVTVRDDATPPDVQVTSGISGYVDTARFKLRGGAAGAEAAVFSSLTAANLGNGVQVRVRGRLQGAQLGALSVTAVPLVVGQVTTNVGTVADYNAAVGTFRLTGLQPLYRLAPDVRYAIGNAAQFANGVRVDVRGVVGSNAGSAEITVREVRILPDSPLVELSGLAGNVQAQGANGVFEVDEVDLEWTAATRFIGATNTVADLADGKMARVTATRVGTVLRAIEVDLSLNTPNVVQARGSVSDFVSLGDFRVAGQRIDARAAVIEPAGFAARLGNGAFVDVDGQMVDGVLRATRVREM